MPADINCKLDFHVIIAWSRIANGDPASWGRALKIRPKIITDRSSTPVESLLSPLALSVITSRVRLYHAIPLGGRDFTYIPRITITRKNKTIDDLRRRFRLRWLTYWKFLYYVKRALRKTPYLAMLFPLRAPSSANASFALRSRRTIFQRRWYTRRLRGEQSRPFGVRNLIALN